MTNYPEQVTPEKIREIHWLMDAIHNIPEFLCEHGHLFTEQMLREGFDCFDKKWGGKGKFPLEMVSKPMI